MITFNETKKLINSIGRNAIESILHTYSEEMLKSAIDLGISPSYISESYQGEYKDDIEFTQCTIGDLAPIDQLPWYVKIDWEKTSGEIMHDYLEENGHYFRNM